MAQHVPNVYKWSKWASSCVQSLSLIRIDWFWLIFKNQNISILFQTKSFIFKNSFNLKFLKFPPTINVALCQSASNTSDKKFKIHKILLFKIVMLVFFYVFFAQISSLIYIYCTQLVLTVLNMFSIFFLHILW